ncbi:46078_t:CDS:2, partial [Gigaspora margarita]
TTDGMNLDKLPEHTAKKAKASLDDEPITTLFYGTSFCSYDSSTKQRNAGTPENQTAVPPSKKTNVPPMNSHSTDLPDIKFLYNNLYLVLTPTIDSHDGQDITMQQFNQTPIPQKRTEPVKENIAAISSNDPPNIIFSQNNPYIAKAHMPEDKEQPQLHLQQPVPTLVNQDTHEQNKDIDIKEMALTNIKGVKPQLPNDKDTLLESIKMIEKAPQIPITEYNRINTTLEWLYEKYEYDKISAYLLELPDQSRPNWGIYKYDDLY